MSSLPEMWHEVPDSVRQLFVSDAVYNQKVKALAEYHPSRFRFIGDKMLSAAISNCLYHKFPQEHAGQLTQKMSAMVSSRSFARMYRTLNLDTISSWAVSERQKGEAFEQFIGLLFEFQDEETFERALNRLVEMIITQYLQLDQ